MKPYHINKKQILIMGCLGMFPLFSSAQDILSTSGTSRWDYSNSRVEREPGRDALDITFSVFPLAGLGSQEVAYLFPVYVSADGRDSVRLEPVCVAGKRRYKVIKRRKALGNLKPGNPGSGEVRSAKVLESSGLTVKGASLLNGGWLTGVSLSGRCRTAVPSAARTRARILPFRPVSPSSGKRIMPTVSSNRKRS